MNQKHAVGSRVIAALLLLAIVQISLQVGLAEPSNTTTPVVVPQQVVARLTTRNNQAILVNGLGANTGASILTGATIETGADQSATVNLGPLGTLDISPNTKLVLTYDDQGNVKAVLVYGCAILTAKKKTTGEIATEQGTAGKTDPVAGGVLNVCFPQGAAAPTVTNTLPTAPAAGGAGGGGGGGLFGLGTAATIAIFGGIGAAALTPLFFQDNPSGSNP
ncbi:MAG TPA: hypothetical protein VFD75_02215 [Pyrinomonadaceae bacterium]|nr:hypothetical protein [Pyrinomonadaceae bacterium]